MRERVAHRRRRQRGRRRRQRLRRDKIQKAENQICLQRRKTISEGGQDRPEMRPEKEEDVGTINVAKTNPEQKLFLKTNILN